MSRVEIGSNSSGVHDVALVACLDVAVPMRIHELQQMTDEQRGRTIAHWAAKSGQILASSTDALMFRTRAHAATATHVATPGTADVFNALARGLAAAAFVPGGATYAGRTWSVIA